MKYVEYCAGIGGTRAGLDAAGWECVLAVDHDPDAVLVHRMAHGTAVEGDVTQLSPQDVPHAHVWVAGFPCQPFSSSGSRSGFGHKSGNVFEHLARLIGDREPPVVVLENVEGLLTNKAGHTFASILHALTGCGYEVDWLVMNLRWYGVPQSRRRLFVVAAKRGVLRVGALPEAPGLLSGPGETVPSVFWEYLVHKKLSLRLRSMGKIGGVIERVRPAIGKAQHAGPHLFGGLGHASGVDYWSFELRGPVEERAPDGLAAIVAPDFPLPEQIRSVRYYSRGLGTRAYTRAEAVSHCVGTSLGGAPLFAVPAATVEKAETRGAFLRFANWHREQDGLLVMRLVPERAVLLFGPHTASLSDAVGAWNGGATRKFKLVGNMVAPVCARDIATIVGEHATEGVLGGGCRRRAVEASRRGCSASKASTVSGREGCGPVR